MEFLNFLDTIKLPFEVPLLLHPPIVHFAIALPIIVLLLEVVNLFIKRPYLNKITSSFLFLIMFIFILAFFTGKADGSNAFSLLSPEGKEELKLHKTIGMYLVYATIIVFLLKLISIFIKKRALQIIYMLSLVAFIGVTFKQGKDGGELVYEYGANVETILEMGDKIMELEDKVDELNEKIEELKQKKIDTKSVSIETTKESNITTTPLQNQSIPKENIEQKTKNEANLTDQNSSL